MLAVLLQLGRLSWQRRDTSSMRSRVNEASWWMRRASRVSPTICIFTFTTSRRVCNSQGRPLGSASGPTRRITVSNWLLSLSAAVTTWRLAVLSGLVIYSCSVRSSTKFRGLFCGLLWWPCLPVCYLSVREHNSGTVLRFSQCYACYLCPWFDPPLAALRYVMYFQFYEWRHVCTCQ